MIAMERRARCGRRLGRDGVLDVVEPKFVAEDEAQMAKLQWM